MTLSGRAFLFDTNVWIGLAFVAHPNHAAATAAFALASAARPATFCRSTQQSVLRLLSSQAMLRAYGLVAQSNREALDTLDMLAASPAVSYRDEPPGVEPIWRRLAALPTLSPKV
jgi:uncharacterized protein